MSSRPQDLGKYELRERLGSGGMAEVWKAFDTQLERYVAIKLMHANLQNDPAFMTRFIREARAIASLRHPNIVQIYDFQTTSEASGPLAYMVMEYIEGGTLADYIRSTSRLGSFPQDYEIVNLFASISRAIDYAHRHGMIHRDIKPANILLDQRNTSQNPMGEPILTDFGIAKLMGAAGGTVTGSWLGTPLYISPEQVQGQPGNERSDLYSLGVILYEICTGVPPFQGETMTAIIMQHISATPTAPELVNPKISSTLSQVILKSLAKDPAARFNTASELTAAVAAALDIPIPADMSVPSSVMDMMNAPTMLSKQSSLPQNDIPLSPPGRSALPLAESPTPALSGKSTGGQGLDTPINSSLDTPVSSSAAVPSQADTGATVLSSTPARPAAGFASPPASASPPSPGRRLRGWHIALIALVILIVLGSGALYMFTHAAHTTAPAAKQVVGHVFLLSSGQVNQHNSQGINDELQIDLHNLSQPAPGKALYAWLLSDKKVTEPTSIFLTTLKITNGVAQFHYTGDAHHTNLLEFYSRFLITEEDANPTPIAPSSDQKAWRYYAELPQIVNPVDNYSLLDHLRHLLAKDPELELYHLHGGLDIWLFRNTQKVMQWAGNARDCWQKQDTACIQNNLIRILDYLDGKVYVQNDVPPGTPNLVDPQIGGVAMLEFDPQNQKPPGYLYHINKHLQGIVQAPGATSDQKQLAAQIDKELNQVTAWLEQVHKDARQLINMHSDQLLSQGSLSLLNQIATQASNAYTGQFDPITNQNQAGVLQIHHDIQRLATYSVTPA